MDEVDAPTDLIDLSTPAAQRHIGIARSSDAPFHPNLRADRELGMCCFVFGHEVFLRMADFFQKGWAVNSSIRLVASNIRPKQNQRVGMIFGQVQLGEQQVDLEVAAMHPTENAVELVAQVSSLRVTRNLPERRTDAGIGKGHYGKNGTGMVADARVPVPPPYKPWHTCQLASTTDLHSSRPSSAVAPDQNRPSPRPCLGDLAIRSPAQ